jgi:desampylase
MWAMALRISRTQRLQLLNWATAAVPHECCGLLLGNAGVIETIELTTNVADIPTREFEIDPAALIAAEKRARHGGAAILGYFHSHPNGVARPSDHDADMAAVDGRTWLIVAAGVITAWTPTTLDSSGPVRFVQSPLVEG